MLTGLNDIDRQPQETLGEVDRANPLSRGLILAVPKFGFRSTQQINNWTRTSGPLRYEHATQFQWWSVESRGSSFGPLLGGGAGYLATQYAMPDLNSQIAATKQVTMSMLCRMVSGAGSGNGQPWDFRSDVNQSQWYPWTDGKIYLNTFAGFNRWADAATSLVDVTIPHIVTITAKNGRQELYQNGLLAVAGSNAVDPSYLINGIADAVGGGADTGTAASYVYALWMWNRILSPAEIRELVRNPWQTFAPSPLFVVGKAAVGGTQTITCTGVASTLAIGTAKLNQQVVATGIASTLAIGSASVSLSIAASGVASGLAIGSPQLNLQIQAQGRASSLIIGTPTVLAPQTIVANGRASTLAIGTAIITVAGANQTITPTGIASTLAIGSAQLNQQIQATGVASTTAIGSAKLNQLILAQGVASSLAIGSPTVIAPQTIVVTGIASTLAIGTPIIFFPTSSPSSPILIIGAENRVLQMRGENRVLRGSRSRVNGYAEWSEWRMAA